MSQVATVPGNEPKVQGDEAPKSLGVFQDGVRTGNDFAKGMSFLMGDLIAGRVTPQVGNAICNAGGKLLKVIEMQQKYGKSGTGAEKDIRLINEG